MLNSSNRSLFFLAAAVVAVACVIIAILYWTGSTGLGHHIKHGILFFAIAVVAALFAAVNRPARLTS
jgi:hypothetical protein